jgi:hypothetical protein
VSDERSILQRELETFDAELKRAPLLDQDTLEEGADLVDRGTRQVLVSCLPATPLDRALILVGRTHATEAK